MNGMARAMDMARQGGVAPDAGAMPQAQGQMAAVMDSAQGQPSVLQMLLAKLRGAPQSSSAIDPQPPQGLQPPPPVPPRPPSGGMNFNERKLLDQLGSQ